MTILALDGLCVRTEYRRRGLGRRLAIRAFDEIRQRGLESCLFQTHPRNQGFYEKLGCFPVANRFVNSLGPSPQANPWWEELVMRYPADAPWPSGTIDLLGEGY